MRMSDKKVFTITFDGPRGYMLEGTFGGCAVTECKFTGGKISNDVSEDVDISQEWHDHDEATYERERVRRWR